MRRTLLVVALLLGACGGGSPTSDTNPDTRILGLTVNPAEGMDFVAASDLAQDAGVQSMHLAFTWNGIETAPQIYGNTLLGVANLYFPARGVPLSLNLQTINTVTREVPSDLESVAWDDPVMISRFKAMLDYLFAQIPDLQISELAIGNEVNGLLRTQSDYDAYRTFFEAARAHVKTIRPDLPVGVTVTFSGVTGPDAALVQSLNANADYLSVTYYPLQSDFTVRDPSEVGGDFDLLVALYPGKPIMFQECGYPSAAVCNSSEQKQSDFVRAVFAAWDRHATRITHITFFLLNDWSDAAVDGYLDYYGVATPEFRGYLISLGMRTWDGSGTDKLAWSTFKQEAAARGW